MRSSSSPLSSSWFEPTISPPSASTYHRSCNDDSRRARHSSNSNPKSKSKFEIEKLLQDPLSRRLMSIISPVPTNNGMFTDIDRLTPTHEETNGVSSSGRNSTTSFVTKWLSPYPHPSFPHRETCVPTFDYDTTSGSSNFKDEERRIHYFFYPRFKHISADYHRNGDNVIRNKNGNENFENLNPIKNNVIGKNNHSRRDRMDQVNAPTQQLNALFDNYSNPITTTTTSRKKQSRIRQNERNGTIETCNNDDSQQNITQSTWEYVGQISSYRQGQQQGIQYDDDHGGVSGQTTSASNQKRKYKKRTNNNDKQQSTSRSGSRDIRTMLLSEPSQDDGDHNNPQNESSIENSTNSNSQKELKWRKSSTTKRKRAPKDDLFPPNNHTTTTETPFISPIPYETLRDFVETYDIKNAGSSTESLREFLRIIKSKKYISYTLVFQDIFCTSPFLPSSKKYCTEKTKCIMWNCTCDNQIRAMQASAPLLGAMFVFPMGEEEDASANIDASYDKLETFILPLAPTSDPDDGSTKDVDSGYERMAQWPFLPITCDTNLQQRWDTFRSILTDQHITCVTFNAQVGLMPYHFHCANDVQQSDDGDGLEKNNIGYMDLLVPNVWDLRLASWMLAPHASEEDLELQKKIDGFRHLLPQEGNETIPPPSASKQFIGLLDTKKHLEFLYIIYPIIDKLLEDNGLKTAFDEIESPVQSVLSAMECLGLRFKSSRLLQIQSKIEARIQDLNVEAQQIAKDNAFNLSSPLQVSTLLYNKMGIKAPSLRSNESSQNHHSTSEQVLKVIQAEAKSRHGQGFRIIDIILEFRSLSKMLNTFIKPYSKLARDNHCKALSCCENQNRRRKKSKSNTESIKMIYPMWMQTTVRTGRLSCRKPNIQQIPTDSIMGVCPRNAFVASSRETCLFACDYTQMEVSSFEYNYYLFLMK